MPKAREERMLAAIAAGSDDAIIGGTLDGRIVTWNAAAERLFGYQAEEVRGRRVTLLLPDERQDELQSLVDRLRNGDRIETFETRRVTKDGREIDVSLTLAPVVDSEGAVLGVSAIAREISERKAMESMLREKEEQYRSVFESSSDGLIINSMDGAVVEVNPAFCRIHGYSREELLCMYPTQFIHPEYYAVFGDYVEALQSGGSFESRAIDVRKDGSLIHVEVHGSVFNYLGQPHMLGVVRDITQQVEAERLLEQTVAERTRELATLLDVSHHVASTLELKPLLGLILGQLHTVVDYYGAALIVVEGDTLVTLDTRIAGVADQSLEQWRFPLESEPAIREWLHEPAPAPPIAPDVYADTPLAQLYRRTMGDLLLKYPMFRSWLGVPLISRNGVIGLLSLNHDQPNFYSERHSRLAMAFADHAAVAVENARLYEAAQEETRKVSVLAEIGASVALAGSLDSVLDGLAKSVVAPTGAVAAAVILLEGDPPIERMAGTYAFPEGWAAAFDIAVRRGARGISRRALRLSRPVVLRNARDTVLSLPQWEPVHRFWRDAPWDTYVSVPLIARGRNLGTLAICYASSDKPTEADLAFLMAVADQAAIAVDNATLLAEAQGKAALEERQRLARELHDSVSQALYGIALGARTARTLLERDPTRLAEPLDYVLSLAEAGLAEMRALIFELRPESLATEGLVAALERQATLLRSRHGLQVETDLNDEPPLAMAQKEALYRISQEATQNIVKHSRAERVWLRLECSAGSVAVEIRDDGVGFQPQQEFPGHLGLRSMRERAAALGGSLAIESAPGHGTRLRVTLSLAPSAG